MIQFTDSNIIDTFTFDSVIAYVLSRGQDVDEGNSECFKAGAIYLAELEVMKLKVRLALYTLALIAANTVSVVDNLTNDNERRHLMICRENASVIVSGHESYRRNCNSHAMREFAWEGCKSSSLVLSHSVWFALNISWEPLFR